MKCIGVPAAQCDLVLKFNNHSCFRLSLFVLIAGILVTLVALILSYGLTCLDRLGHLNARGKGFGVEAGCVSVTLHIEVDEVALAEVIHAKLEEVV
jgi:hypothetical protein